MRKGAARPRPEPAPLLTLQGLRVWGFGFRGSGFRVWGLGVSGLGSRVWGLEGFRSSCNPTDAELWIPGLGSLGAGHTLAFCSSCRTEAWASTTRRFGV